MWQCSNCGELVENSFDVCWNCQTDKGDLITSPGVEQKLGNVTRAAQMWHLILFVPVAEKPSPKSQVLKFFVRNVVAGMMMLNSVHLALDVFWLQMS